MKSNIKKNANITDEEGGEMFNLNTRPSKKVIIAIAVLIITVIGFSIYYLGFSKYSKFKAEIITPNTTSVDSDGRVLVNGTPFFTMGWYTDAQSYVGRTNRLQAVRSSGVFNTVLVEDAFETDAASYLDEAKTNEVKVILKNYAPTNSQISSVATKPALLGWNIQEEGASSNPTTYYNAIKTLGSHLILNVDFKNFNTIAPVSDVLGVDKYPLFQKEVIKHQGDFIASAKGAKAGNPIIAVLEGSSQLAYRDGSSNYRATPPNPDEALNEAYQAIAKGARGIVYYGLNQLIADFGTKHNITSANNPNYVSQLMGFKSDPSWTNMIKVAKEVQAIQNVSLGKDVNDSTKKVSLTTANENIMYLTRQDSAGNYYVIAVNVAQPTSNYLPTYNTDGSIIYSAQNNVTFKIGSGLSVSDVTSTSTTWNNINSIFSKASATISVNNNTFTDSFGPLGVKIYRLNITGSVPIPDATAPVVSITKPINSAIISGSSNMTAIATDAVGVTKTNFYLDNNLIGTVSAAPFTVNIDTTKYINANYSLTAKAYDEAGNIGTSPIIVVKINNVATPTPSTVIDKTSPTLSITTPLNNSYVIRNTNKSIQLFSGDNVKVTKIQIYINNGLKKTTTNPSSSYTYLWSIPSTRHAIYIITSKAYDAAGNVTIRTIKVTTTN